ncbi:MAG: hypothetical protein U9R38_05935 [Candidatus Margulisiibacteriota bacterium]|nr:hypothetical protein [Candidatus Margulisiibacteriota bacterium]
MKKCYQYNKDSYRRIRMLERILINENSDEVKRLLAMVGLMQFALRKNEL